MRVPVGGVGVWLRLVRGASILALVSTFMVSLGIQGAAADHSATAQLATGAVTTGASPHSLFPCYPETDGDYVHPTNNNTQVSGHGWWYNGGCDNNYAYVSVYLEQLINGTWDSRTSNTGYIQASPTNKTSPRVTAKFGCPRNQITYWRSFIYVSNSGGVTHGNASYTTSEQEIDCP